MSKTIRSQRKSERGWQEILNEKKAYIERLQQEEEAKRSLLDWKRILKEDRADDDFPFE